MLLLLLLHSLPLLLQVVRRNAGTDITQINGLQPVTLLVPHACAPAQRPAFPSLFSQ